VYVFVIIFQSSMPVFVVSSRLYGTTWARLSIVKVYLIGVNLYQQKTLLTRFMPVPVAARSKA